MIKVHCRACGLYLGSTNEEDFPIQITCPVCEQAREEAKQALGQPIPETNEKSWLSQIMQRQVDYHNAALYIRRVFDGRE